ncbi:nickel-dependent hydrogenase large subunit [Eggerthellaceae bacterium zg-1084]|uniref:Nickel-dependent hydrogenase large subunit n=1 Tax=Berryella wangjianweii TaxID=2734634 RepID=A0A6M8J5M1_9ACTN|nr:nickel-dependent hydrogenase large subunit [Berryella wangjianweii]NPD30615.1 nickel-dependent hydrogenase large subunit [Berryella wangjianweii]NPD32167.1 nickel-dependent hydrogenase large subunit [Eggerthellaceae bacterium zg-997]QKF07266.1 nickel-dependent hydrogenase large subunit [Berryella wangjianweii]
MTRSVIDPITRIEGHMRVEMEVENGKVVDAWATAGSFRGIELVVENRTPADAAQIVQRICGVCPISHAQSSAIATEQAYGIKIPNNARIIRNLLEGAQFLHSNILWFYNLAALDYVNPLNALKADAADAYALAVAAGTSVTSDFSELKKRLQAFAENGQLSIFSGNWFDAEDGTAYRLPPELDLICTAHYLEALRFQAKSSEISALLGGKMPHIMTLLPGGTSFVPTAQKLDDLRALTHEIYDWCRTTLIPDTLAIAPYYADGLEYGAGCERFLAWGVFESPSMKMSERYLPSGVIDERFGLTEPDESMITEYVGHSWYEGSGTYQAPDFTTKPEFTEYNVKDRYTWCKAPAYGGKPYEATSLSRALAAYQRKVPYMVEQIDAMLEAIGAPGDLRALRSTLGRTAVRQIETTYIAKMMCDWADELTEAVKAGDSAYFAEAPTDSGAGSGFWEAPRGALYHATKVEHGKIQGYQIIIPTTWNLAPINEKGEHGPVEQALIGNPVGDISKPIHALRTVHSFDPCVSCSVHVSEPSTGRKFSTVTNPWGVR